MLVWRWKSPVMVIINAIALTDKIMAWILFLSLHFGVISILVPTFSFYHFQSLNQLARVISVLVVSQLTEKADVANGTIKIIIKKIILALKNTTSAFKLILIK